MMWKLLVYLRYIAVSHNNQIRIYMLEFNTKEAAQTAADALKGMDVTTYVIKDAHNSNS